MEIPFQDVEECQICQGRRFVVLERVYGEPPPNLLPCPVCVMGARKNIDWFAGLEVTEENRKAVARAKFMAREPSGWFVIHGPVGSGKTTLAKAILSHWAGKETQPQTVTQMLDYWRAKVGEGDLYPVFRAMADAQLAVVDDLGAQKVTEWVVERLTEYFDWRYIRRQPTVITTNCNELELAAQVGDRIADRVFDKHTGLVRIETLALPSFRTGRTW